MWTALAYQQLIRTASTYHETVTYAELAEHVQELSGVRTRMLLPNWIGKLLEEVARKAKRNGAPPLTSLCVHQNGTIGDGYLRAPKTVDDTPEDGDIEMFAARHRLLCYQQYAADVPEGGGEPALTTAEAARRNAARARSTREAPPALCPSCSTVLPRSRRCDYCD